MRRFQPERSNSWIEGPCALPVIITAAVTSAATAAASQRSTRALVLAASWRLLVALHVHPPDPPHCLSSRHCLEGGDPGVERTLNLRQGMQWLLARSCCIQCSRCLACSFECQHCVPNASHTRQRLGWLMHCVHMTFTMRVTLPSRSVCPARTDSCCACT